MRVKNRAAILKWINEERKRMYCAPIRAIPKGIPGAPESCPIANALTCRLQAKVLDTEFYYLNSGDGVYDSDKMPLPRPVIEFIVAFDSKKYPQLVKS